LRHPSEPHEHTRTDGAAGGCHDGDVSETTPPVGPDPEVVPSQRRLRLTSVVPVWLLAVVGSVLVLTLTQKDSFAWLLLVFVAAVFVSFVLQLATQTKDGLVERISIASSGSFVVVLVTALILLAR
jgi:hypothetical protein